MNDVVSRILPAPDIRDIDKRYVPGTSDSTIWSLSDCTITAPVRSESVRRAARLPLELFTSASNWPSPRVLVTVKLYTESEFDAVSVATDSVLLFGLTFDKSVAL